MGIKRVPTYFNEFACIGGACEDNCCIGWEVDIDDESLEVYNSVGGEFGMTKTVLRLKITVVHF